MSTDNYFDNEIDNITGGDNDDDSDSDNNSDSSSDDSSIGGGAAVVNLEEEEEEGEGEEIVDDDDEDDDEDDDDEDDDDDDNEKGQSGGGRDDPDEQDEEVRVTKTGKKVKKIPVKKIVKKAFADEISDDENEDNDEDGEMYLKKFDREINENYIVNNHPECAMQNYDEILAMTKVVRDTDNIIIDDLHKTNPFLTKYERARILGQRAKQIETGSTPFVKVPENIIDGYLIAEMELQQGRVPFIIRRPMPNGGSEYWKINDLENLTF